MDDAVVLLAPDGQPAAGRSFSAGGAGLALSLGVPAGRRLASAQLRLAAVEGSAQTFQGPLQSDAGLTTLDGSTPHNLRWASLDWGEERALRGVSLDTGNPPLPGGLRVRLFSRGQWLPLAPFDSLPAGTRQSVPAQAGSRLSAEMLVEGKVGDSPTGVLVPGLLPVRQLSVELGPEPCHLSATIGDNAPFFSLDGPLPQAPLEVAGLARAARRHQVDHPEALSVPLVLRCAGNQAFTVLSFAAELEAPPPAAPPPGPPPAEPNKPRPGEREWIPAAPEATRLARLCDAGHAAAVRLAALPAGSRLSSVALRLRPLAPRITLRLALHRAAEGGPAASPLLAWQIELATPEVFSAGPAWCLSRLPEPLALAGSGWWLICRVADGSALWYAAAEGPAAVEGSFHQRAGGPWLPLDEPGLRPWLQLRAGVLDAAPP